MFSKGLLFVTLLLVSSSALAEKDSTPKCRGLVMEGGGDHGAYEVGFVKGIVEALGADAAYDVVVGTSAGSLNALHFAVTKTGDETTTIDRLVKMWTTVNQDDVYVSWLLGEAQGLLFETGIVDSRPFRKFLTDQISDIGDFHLRSVYASAADLNSGKFMHNHNYDINVTDDFVSSIMGSAAIPVFFPTISWNGQVNSDGGGDANLNIMPAIAECRAKGFKDEDIIIDAVMTYRKHLDPVDPSNYKTKDVYERFKDIFTYSVDGMYVKWAKMAFPDVNFRYCGWPHESLPNHEKGHPFDFNHTDLATYIAIGEVDAKQSMTDGYGVWCDQAADDALTRFAKEYPGLYEDLMKNSQ